VAVALCDGWGGGVLASLWALHLHKWICVGWGGRARAAEPAASCEAAP